MRIMFMGTPDFAVFTLSALVAEKMDVAAVVTQPDKPKGRGYALVAPPVKIFAEKAGIPVFAPVTLRGEEFAVLLEKIRPDIIIVAAYGKILPKNVLSFPEYGCVNVHGSLLPKYRGAAPIQRAIMDGEKTTGITIMQMDEGLDTGDMISEVSVEINDDDNFETLHDKLGAAGAELLIKTLRGIANVTRRKQDGAKASYAAKITGDDQIIDFGKSARDVHNKIRALSPVPLAVTHTPDGKILKIVKAEIESENGNPAPAGTVICAGNKVTVACGNGSVNLLEVLPEGKKKMSAADFARGRKISAGDVLA